MNEKVPWPWGSEILILRYSVPYLVGKTGILVESGRDDCLGGVRIDKDTWPILASGGFEYELVDRTNAWAEFVKHCSDHIQRIRNTKDDGLYAKLYASDVDRLLSMLQNIERSNEGAECVSDAWEDTR